MRLRHLLCLAVLLAVPATSAHAYTYGDTLTTIWRPLPNLPALARPGDAITVWANAPSSAAGWSAALHYGALHVPLTAAGGGWQSTKGRWELQFTVPAGTPEEIYALSLTSDSTPPDTSAHSVKVLPEYRSDYYFAQISDTHLPSHTFSDGSGFSTADTSGMADFDAVIEDLDIIHPEFIVHTGDLVNEGELEEYLAMYEMGRAKTMLNRLQAPIWVSTGNHDIGGWDPTPPPPGTSRKNWWRYFGWPFLLTPPPGDPSHSQDFTFDYGPLHVIGLEAYNNSGQYDDYNTGVYGPDSFTNEQLTWLQNDIAAHSASKKLLFYHYDFGGFNADFTQINVNTLGLDGALWGHFHTIADTGRTRRPFSIGTRSVIDYRGYRLIRVHDGVMSPARMVRAGGTTSAPTDSLAPAWSGPNDGTRRALTLTVLNRFNETWEHARVTFNLADHDSDFVATGGTIAQVIRQGGMANVAVDFVVPASGSVVVSVQPSVPITGVDDRPAGTLTLFAPSPNPFRVTGGALALRFTLPSEEDARLELIDVSGRRVATLTSGRQSAGDHVARWNGRTDSGGAAAPGLYFARLTTAAGAARTARFVLTR